MSVIQKLRLPDHNDLPPGPVGGDGSHAPLRLPDHNDLPCTDGTFVKNTQEHPQSVLLTDTISPRLHEIRPDNRFFIGQDCGIYWRVTEPESDGAEAPDWFCVLNVPATLDGKPRRSYVLWQEWVAPAIILEFASRDGSEELDRTPITGKFWVYETVIRPAYYGVYFVNSGRIDMHHLVEDRFEPLPANERGHFPILPLGVELGIWRGTYLGMDLPWLRWFDTQGKLLPTGHELAEQERQRAEQERQRAERLAEQLRKLGVNPDQV